MAYSMSLAESDLRNRLDLSVTKLRLTIKRLPDFDTVGRNGMSDLAVTLHEANEELSSAERLAVELQTLEAASDEAALLATTASVALGMIRALLATVVAEFDSRAA